MINRRIEACFERLAGQRRAGLIAYIMAADPDPDSALETILAIRDAGADLIEIGMPFTDPVADGPVIQAAGLRALASGVSMAGTLELAARFRAVDAKTPLILMSYANPLYRFGYSRLAEAAAQSGFDAVIGVDLPPEEDAPLRRELEMRNLATIRLATPTSDAGRMRQIMQGASGFLYYVSVAGITGAGSGQIEAVSHGVELARAAGDLPVAVGFGVSTARQVAELSGFCDAVVVGSALVERLYEAYRRGESPAIAGGEYIAALAASLSG